MCMLDLEAEERLCFTPLEQNCRFCLVSVLERDWEALQASSVSLVLPPDCVSFLLIPYNMIFTTPINDDNLTGLSLML